VEPVPTLLAALLAHGQTKGPAEIPAKRIYMMTDTVRIARSLGVPFEPPASHPFNPLLPLRVATVEPKTIDALFQAVWAKSTKVDTDEAIAGVLDASGFSGSDLVAKAHQAETKERLRSQTEAAIARGVFGVPTMFAKDQMFWGTDSLGHLERHLAGDGIDVAAEVRKWSHVRPTASRKVG
jgi:2-hydroxychromene-2-carboxylate isomerase